MPEYFIGASIIAATWGLFYFKRPDLRRVMLRGSIYGFLFGFTEKWFIPDYWTPPESLFGLIERWGFGVESLMVGFFVGGLAAVVYPFYLRESQKKVNSSWYFFALIALPFYYFLELLSPETTIYNMVLVFSSLAVLLVLVEPRLLKRIVVGALLFTVTYMFLFYLFGLGFPYYIPSAYQGDYILILPNGLPIEEALFSFSVGAFWSGSYKG